MLVVPKNIAYNWIIKSNCILQKTLINLNHTKNTKNDKKNLKNCKILG